MTILLPGDIVPVASGSVHIKLGPGLLPSPQYASSSEASSSLSAIRAGALGHVQAAEGSKSKSKDSEAFWIETNTRRYIPSPGDSVVCQITNRGAESYTVSLYSAHQATLPALSFEGATKRHKPNLKIGALVYAKVVSADRFTEPELTCVNAVTGKSDGFGDLKTTDERGEKTGHAMLFRVSLGLARTLLRPSGSSGLMKHIATHFAFEAAIGQNGCVWVRASEPKHIIAIGKVLEAADQVATAHHSAADEPEMDTTDVNETQDADWILKYRARRLDAKTVRKILQDYL